MTALLLTNLVVILGLATLVWSLSLLLRDAGIVDLFWGAGFVIVAWSSFLLSREVAHQSWLLPLLVTLWGGRLTGYLALRNLGHAEDKRYAAMRERGGPKFWWTSLLSIFWLQATVLWLVALPLQLAQVATVAHGWEWLQWPGLLLWGMGLFFETVGDAQLASFKRRLENRGKILRTGLWRYTRHPNYFGDFLVWWGLYLVAVAAGAPLWTAIGPFMMSVFLVFVSGVAMTERIMLYEKPDYADYIATTNAFFPWLPRHSEDGTEKRPVDATEQS